MTVRPATTHDDWEQLYESKSPEETSWYQPHLQISPDWVSDASKDKSASIIDVGGGESTLVDDLLGVGYRSLTILDIAGSAIKKSRGRMGSAAQSVSWLVGDATTVALPSRAFDVWHDRAVFHFLTGAAQWAAYVGQLVSALKPGWQVILATFGPQGPHRCGGLDTLRYDRESLQDELGRISGSCVA